MESKHEVYEVNGKKYEVWADYIRRAMFAKDENGIVKKIHSTGYISNAKTVEKAIKAQFAA